jgi:hypothetical protein
MPLRRAETPRLAVAQANTSKFARPFGRPLNYLLFQQPLRADPKTAGVWLNLRSLRSKSCPTLSVGGFG